jgi:1-acyl-sn-glycerol-3-phosphate acyltransferase
LKLLGWSLVGELPASRKFVFIAAPHTSNWDLPLMLFTAWALRVRVHWLGKHTLFVGPFGRLFRMLGGLPVDRRSRGGVVGQVVELFARSDALCLAVSPEASREHRDHWRSGFYHIARQACVPLATGFLDYATRRCGLGPLIELTGDVPADMARIRAFYGPLKGKHPELQGPIRLREEADAEAPSASCGSTSVP